MVNWVVLCAPTHIWNECLSVLAFLKHRFEDFEVQESVLAFFLDLRIWEFKKHTKVKRHNNTSAKGSIDKILSIEISKFGRFVNSLKILSIELFLADTKGEEGGWTFQFLNIFIWHLLEGILKKEGKNVFPLEICHKPYRKIVKHHVPIWYLSHFSSLECSKTIVFLKL